MNAFDLLLAQWEEQVKEIFPDLHTYQQKTLAFCVQGVMLSGSAVMQHIAEKIWECSDSETKIQSHEQRLQRFAKNGRIVVEDCWKQFLQQILPYWQKKSVTLVLDMTPYTEEFTIVYLGLLVHSRILPLVWHIMPQQEHWDQGQWEIVGELFDLVAPLLSSTHCTLLADRGLTSLRLIQLCRKVGWHWTLRIKQSEWFRIKYRHFYRDWQQGKYLVKKEVEQWYGQVLLWQEHQFATWLSIYWETGSEEAWYLISDQRASHKRVIEYARRMKVESTFQDYKSRGCFIECSSFTNREHLNRWLFVVYLATWWAGCVGCKCIHYRYRRQIDRTDRRDKGLLRLGRLWLKALLKKAARALRSQTRQKVAAHLARWLLFSHREARLYFSLCLS